MKLSLLVLFLSVTLSSAAFNRISTFFVCKQTQEDCNFDEETVAEIVDATPDGMTLVYTDGKGEAIGMVDITDASNPVPAGKVDVGGEPTSVGVSKDGKYAYAAVNTSPDFVNPSGVLHVIEISSKTIVASLDLGGQPDSIKVSPDDQYIAIAIENERDEDLNDGVIPQYPAGYLAVVDTATSTDPTAWIVDKVVLANITQDITAPSDPEPEFVDINSDNICVLTLQENNGIALIDLPTRQVISIFDAGSVDLTQIDTTEDKLISQTESKDAVPREADAVMWLDSDHFATADEGDYLGGSRGMTIYNKDGSIVYTSGNFFDHQVAKVGHYPDERSGNKGSEPEGGTFATYGDSDHKLFINTERSSLVFVYGISDPSNPTDPTFEQVLPSGFRPEGIVAIPGRNLLAAAGEVDERGAKVRSSISIYEYQANKDAVYPSLQSADRADGTPIPFSALSGLACANAPGLDNPVDDTIFTIEDSFYQKSRMLQIDTSSYPYTITKEFRITDPSDILAGVQADMVNDDKTVNLDSEGITVANDGGLWLASEGAGTVGDADRPVTTPNLLLKVSATGEIEQVVQLPEDVSAIQVRFGFEGVAMYDGSLVVAFQRAWGDETNPRIGIYNIESKEWKFVYYPLDAPKSQNGGWVGLSDISPLGQGQFLVLERDNQGSVDAVIKQYCTIDLGAALDVAADSELTKSDCKDLIPGMLEKTHGAVFEKTEGLCVTNTGMVWVNNDNDGVDDNSGESMLLQIDTVTLPGEPGTTAAPTATPEEKPSGSIQLAATQWMAIAAIVVAAMW